MGIFRIPQEEAVGVEVLVISMLIVILPNLLNRPC